VMSVTSSGFAQKAREMNPDENTSLVALGNNRFALQLYQKLRDSEGNLFFSPYSISTALAMTYAGARGQTQEQMAQVLCLPTLKAVLETLGADRPPMSPEEFARVFAGIIKDLNVRGGRKTYELRVANALWGQKDYEFLASFVKLVEDQYGGHLERVDFVAAAEKARRTINAWVEKQTNDKIKDLISPGALDAMTRLVLTNAIYFKGNWARQFKPDQTKDEPFTLLDGGPVQTPMMNQKGTFGYAETATLQVLEMPYVGGELTMVVLLPKTAAGIDELEKTLTNENLSQWLGGLSQREVTVSLPRFKMTRRFDLCRVLQSMGMTDAFTGDADFSGMTPGRELYVSAVIHQAYVEVNEEGTEAAAATGVTMRLTSLGPDTVPVFRADHPFIFLIRDVHSGSILFLGRILNPRG
jgi:serpin B